MLLTNYVSPFPPSQKMSEIILFSQVGPAQLTDTEILQLVAAKQIPAYKLETALSDHERGVKIRRKLVSQSLPAADALTQLPFTNYDYTYVRFPVCSENKDLILSAKRMLCFALNLTGKFKYFFRLKARVVRMWSATCQYLSEWLVHCCLMATNTKFQWRPLKDVWWRRPTGDAELYL